MRNGQSQESWAPLLRTGDHWLTAPAAGGLSFFQRGGRLRGHVVFIVLCQDLGGAECAIAIQMALRNSAFPFLEEIRENPLEGDGHALDGVRDDEMDGQSVAFPYETPFFHHPSDAKAAPLRHFPAGDLSRCEEEHEI